MKKHVVIKMVLMSLIFFVSKVLVLGQNTDIKCEVSSLDLNLSGSKASSELGSFSVFVGGKELKEEKGVIIANKFYNLPGTKLILSIAAGLLSQNELTPYEQFSMSMILGRKRFPLMPSTEPDEEEMIKNAISIAQTVYPIKVFDGGGKGELSTQFLEKEKPVLITMKCKKVKKEGS